MNSTELATAIQKHSKELDELIALSCKEGNGISAIHHELIKQKCIILYDLILKWTPTATEEQHTDTGREEASPLKPVNLFTVPVPLVNDIPIGISETLEEPISKIPAPPIIEEKTETEIQNEIIDEIIELKEDQATETPIPLLKEVINELSLHEKIASALPPKADLTERIISTISSLKSAINVNLKIAMVNELFNESSVEYVKAIDKLNSSENIHEAMRYFSELKHTYSWDSDNSLVKELETLIAKRFSV